jgi:hypothetical protein
MKKFKQLFTQLLEDYTEGGSIFNGFSDMQPRTANSDYGVHRIEGGDSISRINAFIHKFLGGTYIDPNAAVALLRSKLNHIGLDFDFDGKKVKLNPGINNFLVKLHGDVFGQTPTTDLSKGFNRGEDLPKLNLEINCIYDEESCMWRMTGKLKPPVNLYEKYDSRDINEVFAALATAARAAIPAITGALRAAPGAVGTGVKSAATGLAGRVSGNISTIGTKVLGAEKFGALKGAAVSTAKQLVSPENLASGAVNYGATRLAMGGAPAPVSDPNAFRSGPPQTTMGEYGNKKKSNGKMCEGGDCGEMKQSMSQDNFSGYKSEGNPLFEEAKKSSARSLMHAINRKGEIKDKILMPVYNNLLQKKNKGKLKTDDLQKQLFYVVNSAMRKTKISLTDKEKHKVVNDLIRNFRKFASSKKQKTISTIKKEK